MITPLQKDGFCQNTHLTSAMEWLERKRKKEKNNSKLIRIITCDHNLAEKDFGNNFERTQPRMSRTKLENLLTTQLTINI